MAIVAEGKRVECISLLRPEHERLPLTAKPEWSQK
jgi:hypothetical protein